MKTERKAVGATIKAAGDDGSFEAVIATFGVVDRDGDIVEPGAFDNASVSVLPAHDDEHVPLGKATIEERGDKAVAVGAFNMDISAARDWHSALKFDLERPPAIQEWSWDFRAIESSNDTLDGQKVRRLVKVHTKEVSPVLRGASLGTGTIEVKRAKAEGRSDNDRRELLERALLDDVETEADWLYVEAVFSETGVVVYTMALPDSAARLYERDFQLAGDTPTFGDERRDVVRDQSYRVVGKADGRPPGLKLADELRWLTGDVGASVKRVLEVIERRKAEGRKLGEPVTIGALDLGRQCRELDEALKSLRDVAVGVVPQHELAAVSVEYLRQEAERLGVA